MKLGYGIAVLLGLSLTHVGIAACQISPTAPVAPTGEQSIQPAAQESVPAAPSHGKAAEAAAKPPPVKPTPKRHKPASTKTQPSDGPKKVVVREGGAREPAEQMAPDITPAEALRQRQNAEQWLGSADDRLKQLARAGDGGADSQLRPGRAFGAERGRCAPGQHAGGEGPFTGGRSNRALTFDENCPVVNG
ncbi:MAG: hypothetical protein ABSD53_23095 [Terriglobales bacterium]